MDKTFITFLIILGISTIGLFTLSQKSKNDTTFQSFKTNFRKQYMSQAEQQYRKIIFYQNLVKIQKHNSNKANTYLLGITQFADLSQDQFISAYLNTKINQKFIDEISISAQTEMDMILKQGDIDWVSQGKVSVIKNQGKCGSCWAFAATSAIQSALLFKGISILLSEQQIMDCSGSYGNHGCDGGWMDYAFQYIRDYGVKSQSEYPYKAINQVCGASNGGPTKISGYVDVPGCQNLLNALYIRPVATGVDASSWSLYKQGVFSNCTGAVNHGVMVVGATSNYWNVKNSFGDSWGEKGYIRLALGNTCGVCSYPSYPIL